MVLKKRLTNLGSLIKRPNQHDEPSVDGDADTPEANAARGVRLFCESGAANSGEEVLHLPTIVEAAVASPVAASAAASQIRKFLSKENYSRPHVQYNAVMLIRILADNPGPSFTKNLDKQFADTIKHLLRNGQDPSVSQILRETLDAMEREKAYDTNLNILFAMWKKEKGLMANAAKQFGTRTLNAPPWNSHQSFGGGGGGGGGRASSRTLPPPVELASRIEEARTSAKLLLQLVQSTPPHELLGNDLVKEFSERCSTAQRSIHGYINCDSPAPDDDTMLTLIETNEQLSLAASKHQRAVLQARRAVQGPTPSPPVPQDQNQYYPPPTAPAPVTSYTPPPQPPPRNEVPVLPPLDVGARGTGGSYDKEDLPLPPALQAAPGRQRTSTAPAPVPAPAPEAEDDPFADHHSPGYAPPPGPPPPRRGEDVSPVNGQDSRPHDPVYQSAPSYLGRQESSANNLTMHGGAQQRGLTEEGEYARDYPAGDGPRTSEFSRPRQGSDVSPVAERAPVTYRY